MHVQPYLSFHGRTEEALNFYAKAIGAETVMVMRFRDAPDQSAITPGNADRIMHATFRVGSSEINASDGMADDAKQAKFEGITLTLYASSVAEAEALFAALSEGGQVQMPLTKTFFSPGFGMLADQFGVPWIVLVRTNA